MLSHHHTFSARTETNRNLRRRLLALVMGSAMSLTAFGAYGMESPRGAEATQGAFTGLPLPPIPYLDTMPWLKWQPAAATMKIDILLPQTSAPTGIWPQPTPYPAGLAAAS
ncbi:hypothetical protein XH83_20775 [Bradyrhizobium sp. CCBAU 53351]|uniref:hypothetical protein n=1 Tax=Bradyrhizobium sp. CCBAU 53351 TaxID=1325114 RepID=UPI001888340E|nr:hypothetical protein [Bradyrhizobium sp. CCBAU 53351]QOZ77661.1 hypothetical protein XH83_20775 [Bradyrhizobium sp. CCBAU 53351]